MANNQLALREEERDLFKIVHEQSTIKRLEAICGAETKNVIENILLAANANPKIWTCTPQSVIMSAMDLSNMDLSLSPSLGQACMLPFEKKKQNEQGKWEVAEVRAVATPMVRGLKKMALETGKYLVLNAFMVWPGQRWVEDQMTGLGRIEGHLAEKSDDPSMTAKVKPIGFGAYLKLTTGYEAALFMTYDQVMAHAVRYSPTYSAYKKEFGDKSRWVVDFNGMGLKTVMKALIMNKGVIDEKRRKQLESAERLLETETDYPDDDLPLTKQAPDQSSVVEGSFSPAPEPPTVQEGTKTARPFEPEVLRQKIGASAKEHLAKKTVISAAQKTMLAPNMKMLFIGFDNADELRHKVLHFLTGAESVTKLSDPEAIAIKNWLDCKKRDDEWLPSDMATEEARRIIEYLAEETSEDQEF